MAKMMKMSFGDRPTWPDTGETMVPMRLQKFLARAGVASRRKSEDLMTAGRVCVNGMVVSELGAKVDPASDTVTVDGRPIRLGDGHKYLMLNKPAGYVTTMSDPQGRPCVAKLVPHQEMPGLFPVGRLDRDTTGLLLFTTNGEVAQQLLHPSHHVWKHYLALVDGTPSERELDRLRRGITLDDGPTAPAEVDLIPLDAPEAQPVTAAVHTVRYGNTSVVGLRIREGRKRQVKRMLRAIGHPVLALHRDVFGPLVLHGVASGSWRELSASERAAIEALGR